MGCGESQRGQGERPGLGPGVWSASGCHVGFIGDGTECGVRTFGLGKEVLRRTCGHRTVVGICCRGARHVEEELVGFLGVEGALPASTWGVSCF